MKIDLVILAGGKGKRIKRYLKGTCKPLIKINGKPFLDYLLKKISKFDIKNIIILAGYKGNQIFKKYNNKTINLKKIKCFIEKKPLGTGGALLQVKKILTTKFLVINGDTIFNINLNNIIKKKLEKDLSFLALTNSNKKRRGKLNNLNIKNNLIILDKKLKYQNGGIYLLNKSILDNFYPNTFSSLEGVIEKKIKQKKVIGKYYKSYFLDIGTPKDLRISKKKLIN